MRLTFRTYPETLPRVDLPAGEVHVWTAPLDPPPLPPAVLTAPLSVAEQARRDRFAVPAARSQFAYARGLLRHLLAAYVGRSPAELRFDVSPDGKPALADCGIEFNVSHTAGLAVFAVSSVPVGVDVERVRDLATAAGLVDRYFRPAERVRFSGLPDDLRTAAFFRGWTCKEAILKGVGCGTRGLEQCEVEIDPRSAERVYAAPDGRPWAVTCWEPAAGYVGAVAVC